MDCFGGHLSIVCFKGMFGGEGLILNWWRFFYFFIIFKKKILLKVLGFQVYSSILIFHIMKSYRKSRVLQSKYTL
jgi:hypothetical protein